MLIKLPSSINKISQVTALIADLQAGKLESAPCADFFETNSRFSREPQAIKMVIEYLQSIEKKPIELVVIFAQKPDEEFVSELVGWARANIHENILLRLETDPILSGGVVVRTPQRIYDFSWSNLLGDKKDLLTKLVSHAH